MNLDKGGGLNSVVLLAASLNRVQESLKEIGAIGSDINNIRISISRESRGRERGKGAGVTL